MSQIMPFVPASPVVPQFTPVTPVTPVVVPATNTQSTTTNTGIATNTGITTNTGTPANTPVFLPPCEERFTQQMCQGTSPGSPGSSCSWKWAEQKCRETEAGDADAICESLDPTGCQTSTVCFWDAADLECTPNSEREIPVLPLLPVS